MHRVLPFALAALFGCTDAFIVYAVDAGPDDAGPLADAGPVQDAGSPDARADAGGGCEPGPPQEMGVGAEGPCELERFPTRPRNCPETESLGAIQLVLHDVDLDDFTVGHDLDAYCSGVAGLPNSCRYQTAQPVPDRDGGRDNSFLSIVEGLLLLQPDFYDEIREAERLGRWLPLVTIEDWNGSPNDDALTITFAVSVRGESTPGEPANFDGTDTFYPNTSLFMSDGTPLITARDAYVADGTLVMTLPATFPIVLDAMGGRLSLRLSDARLVGQLSPEGLLSNVILAGRWPVDEVVANLDLLGLCETGDPFIVGARRMAERAIERWADLRVSPSEDGNDFICNAISAQVLWRQSAPAIWGDPIDGDEFTGACP